jgi:polyphenol oxidase
MTLAANGKNAVVNAHPELGRIVVPRGVPPGFTLFYTTNDFDGRIDDRIRRVIHPATLATCHQVHGVASVRAGFSRPDRLKPVHTQEPTCDALWTDEKNAALAIKVADCLPVSIIDPKNSIIANIHSGWRGTVQGITATTLDAAPLDPSESFAFLGPSIRVCCFEVGEEVAAQFDARFIDRTLGPKPHVDIAAVTIAVLRDRGFAAVRIVDSGLCTRCGSGVAGLLGYSVAQQPSNSITEQPLFHSYRRDKRAGRNLAIVAQ